MAGGDQAAALAELRRDIDRIDRTMHEALMERGRIIDRLIAVKGGTAESGSAFRPEREASMMRNLARRHEGGLPFNAVEGIWRIVISTFTHLQAPFAVQADLSGDSAATRDSARFHFGFIVPFVAAGGPAAVIAAVAASHGDLGIVPVEAEAPRPWWQALEPQDAPKIIARLPFVDRPDHPAAHPLFVVAKSVSGEGLGESVLTSVRQMQGAAGDLAEAGGRLVASCGADALISLSRDVDLAGVVSRLGAGSAIVVGSHPSTSPA